VIGDVLDAVIVVTSAPHIGQDDPAASIRHRPGGSAADVAAWLGWLGADVDFVGRAGVDDVYRHERALADAGVRAHIRYDGLAGTGAVVTVDNPRGRSGMTDPGAAGGLGAADVPRELVEGADLVHLAGAALLGGAGADGLAELVAHARSGGGRVSLDPSSVAVIRAIGRKGFVAAMHGVDVLLPDRAEATALTGLADPVEAAAALTAHAGLVVVTLAEQGAVVARPGRSPQRVAAAPVEVVDRTGVGDAFAAGTICALATDPVRIGAAVREGARVAARSLRTHGGRPPV
jgi:sugar/nucleoside kinase (ribokinase family)